MSRTPHEAAPYHCRNNYRIGSKRLVWARSSPRKSNLEMTLVLGVDVGTTAVKCVLLRASGRSVAASADMTISDMPERDALTAQELQGQDVGQVLNAVDRAFAALPADLLQQISSISICGQVCSKHNA